MVDILNGVAGYAYKQANIAHQLESQFGVAWVEILQKHGIKPEWAERFCKDQNEAIKKGDKKAEDGEEEDERDEDNEDKGMLDDELTLREERLGDESDNDEELTFND
jgi:hypothetical protein